MINKMELRSFHLLISAQRTCFNEWIIISTWFIYIQIPLTSPNLTHPVNLSQKDVTCKLQSTFFYSFLSTRFIPRPPHFLIHSFVHSLIHSTLIKHLWHCVRSYIKWVHGKTNKTWSCTQLICPKQTSHSKTWLSYSMGLAGASRESV